MFQHTFLLFVVISGGINFVNRFPTHQKHIPRFTEKHGKPDSELAFTSIMKLTVLYRPGRKDKGKKVNLIYLVALLLTLSMDVESNPGPNQVEEVIGNSSTVFPCGSCFQPVTWVCKGVECDGCFTWYHADCQNISNSMYDRMGQDSSKVGVWKCLACENINVTSNQTASLDSFESQNHFDVLNDTPDMIIIYIVQTITSTPKTEIQNKTKPKSKKNKIKRSVKVEVINCRSIIDKKQEYENLLHSTKPDIIIGTESWLKPKHYDNEIFDPDMGYIPYRRDRIGQTGGGVFIAVRDTIIAQRVKEYETDCENIWVKIELAGQKPLIHRFILQTTRT